MHGPTWIFWANLTLFSLQCEPVDTLRSLSYNVKLGAAYDEIPMVMETRSGTCDSFSGDFCRKFSAGKTPNVPVDTCIVSTIAAFLESCRAQNPASPCDALDVGANMGTMTSNMLRAGARVTAVEPQRDLAALVWETACLNSWGDRLTLYNNAITAVRAEAGEALSLGNRAKTGNWGFRPDGSHLKANAASFEAKKVWLESVLGGTTSFAFVKIDTDSVDDMLTKEFGRLIQAEQVDVTTFSVESPSAVRGTAPPKKKTNRAAAATPISHLVSCIYFACCLSGAYPSSFRWSLGALQCFGSAMVQAALPLLRRRRAI
jgi:FkbM family methyltransferase